MGVLGRDWVSKEPAEIAPGKAEKANVVRSMCRVGKLHIHKLELGMNDRNIEIKDLHGGCSKSQSQISEVYEFEDKNLASKHMFLPRN